MKSLVCFAMLAASSLVQGQAQQPAAPFATMEGRTVTLQPSKVFPAPTAQFPAPTLTTPPTGNDWSQSRLYYVRRGGDFSAAVNLDFFVREFGRQTVVMVFHTPPATRLRTWDPVMPKIIDSFAWPK